MKSEPAELFKTQMSECNVSMANITGALKPHYTSPKFRDIW